VLSPDYHKKIDLFLLCLLAFSFPFIKIIVSVIIVLLCLNRLFAWDWTGYRVWLKKPAMLFAIIFYLLLVIGMLWTENIAAGWFDLQVKLSLLVFPLILVPVSQYSKGDIRRIKLSFVGGCLIAIICLLSYALYRFANTEDSGVFFYNEFSRLVHPGYFAMYLNLGLIILLNELFSKNKKISRKSVYVFLMFVFSIFVLMLVSRAGIFSLLLIMITGFVAVVSVKKNWISSILLVGCLIGAFVLLYTQSETIKRRLDVTFTEISSNSPNGRMAIWKAGTSAIFSSPILGHGTGDVKDVIVYEYERIEYQKGVDKNLNAHNQFLQSTIAVGLPGGVLLLLLLVFPFLSAVKNNRLIYGLFLVIISVGFMTESVLETQAGVTFYAFFNAFLFYSQRNE